MSGGLSKSSIAQAIFAYRAAECHLAPSLLVSARLSDPEETTTVECSQKQTSIFCQSGGGFCGIADVLLHAALYADRMQLELMCPLPVDTSGPSFRPTPYSPRGRDSSQSLCTRLPTGRWQRGTTTVELSETLAS
jgi:hypothetical protein